MDIERIIEKIATLDRIYIEIMLNDEFSCYYTFKIMTVTEIGNCIKIMGEDGTDVEIPIASITNVEFVEDEDANTIVIHTSYGQISIFSRC